MSEEAIQRVIIIIFAVALVFLLLVLRSEQNKQCEVDMDEFDKLVSEFTGYHKITPQISLDEARALYLSYRPHSTMFVEPLVRKVIVCH